MRTRRDIQAQNRYRALSLTGQCWFAKLDMREEVDLQGTSKELGSPLRVSGDVCCTEKGPKDRTNIRLDVLRTVECCERNPNPYDCSGEGI